MFGLITPDLSAFLHNASTVYVSARSTRRCLPPVRFRSKKRGMIHFNLLFVVQTDVHIFLYDRQSELDGFQPEDRFRSVGVVDHGKAVADNFRLSLHKSSIQKKRPVGKMNPIRFRGKILHQCRQPHQLHNVADFAGDIAHRTAFQLLKISPRRGSSSVTRPSGMKKPRL